MEKRDLVFLEQVKDTVVVLLDDLVFASDQGIEIEFDIVHLDAVFGKAGIDLVVMLGRLQQRLGRNTSDVSASAARSRLAGIIGPGVDTRNIHAQLGGTNRGNVPTRPCTDNDYIKFF